MINRRNVEKGLGPLIFQLGGLLFTFYAKLQSNWLYCFGWKIKYIQIKIEII